jgi:hypothetical protein
MWRMAVRLLPLWFALLYTLLVVLHLFSTSERMLDLARQDRSWAPAVSVMILLPSLGSTVLIATGAMCVVLVNAWRTVDTYEARIRLLEEHLERTRVRA